MSDDEKKCLFVSTRGIAKSCNIHPDWDIYGRMSYSSFTTQNKIGSSIYLHFDMVEQFINNYLDKMENPFVIVSGNSDHTVIDDIPSAHKLLDHDKLIMWYSQNVTYSHPKLNHIPIGVDYHTLSISHGNHDWTSLKTPISPVLQESELRNIKKTFIPLINTRCISVTNFHLAMGPPLRRTQIRTKIYNILKDKKGIEWLPKQTREEFWKSLNDVAFVICPFGNGLDTHRAWEAISLGRIPIIEKSELNEVFKDLPVAIIDDWNNFNEIWLEREFTRIVNLIKNKEYKLNKVLLTYWSNKINSH